MTTPAGVPNLPIGALTVETLGDRLQNQSPAAMRSRAGEQMPGIFGASTGGNILADLSPFGILTAIWADINSRIAGADPVDIQGPEDLPPLFLDFIEGLPVIGQFVTLLEALLGTYEGDDPTLLGIQDLFGPIRTFIETVGQGIADFLAWIWDNFGTAVETFLKPVAEFLSWLWQGVSGGFGGFGDIVDSVLKPIFEWLHWVWLQFGSALDTFLKPIATLAKSVWDMFAGAAAGIGATAEALLEDLWGFLSWLWNGVAGGFAGFGGVVDSVLKPIFEWLHWVWGLFGSSVESILKPAFEFLHLLFGTIFSGNISGLTEIFQTLATTVQGVGDLGTWISHIPLIGPLVGAITQQSPVDGVPMDLSSLGAWARKVLTGDSDIPAGNLKGLIPAGILSSIPLSNIAFDTPNLLSQGDFGSAGTIDPADGWTWDSSQNHSGSGGCAKVACNGTARRLYSNQVIKVVAGDQINLSSYVKTSSDFAGGSSSIELILVPFSGTDRYTVAGSPVNVYFNTRGSTSNAWVAATGSSGSGTAPWTVPTGVTSVRVRLSVTSAATAGSVWFDDIDMHKTGLLSGNWMTGILGTVAQDIQGTVDQILQGIKGIATAGTGNPLTNILSGLQSIFTTLFGSGMAQLPTNIVSNPLQAAAIPGLQASKITSGTFDSTRIADDAITTAKIAADAVTSTEIAGSAVGTTELATAAVTNVKVSGVDGTKITTGTISIDHLPKSDLGLLGSGAHMCRAGGSGTFNATAGQHIFAGFFDTLQDATSDIGYGLAGSYFQVTYAGWYRVELGFYIDSSTWNSGWNVAPAIWKNSSLYRIGADAPSSAFRSPRFANSSFSVYLGAGDSVQAGYDSDTTKTALFAGNSLQTYFGITLLNRSYA